MLSLNYWEWLGELETLVNDIYDINVPEFLEGEYSAHYYFKQGYSPVEALEALEEEKLA